MSEDLGHALLLQRLGEFTASNQATLKALTEQTAKLEGLVTRFERAEQSMEKLAKRVDEVEKNQTRLSAGLLGLTLAVVGVVWGPAVAFRLGLQFNGWPVGAIPMAGGS